MHTPSSFSRVAVAVTASAMLFAATAVQAQVRPTTTTRVTTTTSSSASSKTSSASSKTIKAPTATNIGSVSVSELPSCGGTDSLLMWDSKAKKWACKSLLSLMPPKCDGADQALRFDGTSWKCETIAGLLVAHASVIGAVDGTKKCDTKNTWGGATCTVNAKEKTAVLTCPVNTIQVNTNALSGYAMHETYTEFGGDFHAFCYSRSIKIAK